MITNVILFSPSTSEEQREYGYIKERVIFSFFLQDIRTKGIQTHTCYIILIVLMPDELQCIRHIYIFTQFFIFFFIGSCPALYFHWEPLRVYVPACAINVCDYLSH